MPNILMESIQYKCVKYALRRLSWSESFVLPPYAGRGQLISLEKLSGRPMCIFFLCDLLSGRIDARQTSMHPIGLCDHGNF